MSCVAGEMAQRLRALVVRPGDTRSIPITHMASYKLPVTLPPGDRTPSHRHARMSNTSAHKIKINKSLKTVFLTSES